MKSDERALDALPVVVGVVEVDERLLVPAAWDWMTCSRGSWQVRRLCDAYDTRNMRTGSHCELAGVVTVREPVCVYVRPGTPRVPPKDSHSRRHQL